MVYQVAECGFESGSPLERAVLRLLSEGLTTSRELADKLNGPLGSIRNLMARLLQRGVVCEANREGRQRRFELAYRAEP